MASTGRQESQRTREVISMAKMTKTQAKRALRQMQAKIFKIAQQFDEVSYKDAVQLEALTQKLLKRF